MSKPRKKWGGFARANLSQADLENLREGLSVLSKADALELFLALVSENLDFGLKRVGAKTYRATVKNNEDYIGLDKVWMLTAESHDPLGAILALHHKFFITLHGELSFGVREDEGEEDDFNFR